MAVIFLNSPHKFCPPLGVPKGPKELLFNTMGTGAISFCTGAFVMALKFLNSPNKSWQMLGAPKGPKAPRGPFFKIDSHWGN